MAIEPTPSKPKTWRRLRIVASIAVVLCLAANASRSAQYWKMQSPRLMVDDFGLYDPILQQSNASKPTIVSPCVSVNSPSWLQGPRHNNLQNDPLLTPELAKKMILNLDQMLLWEEKSALSTLLGQTICHEQSSLRNTTPAISETADSRTIRRWSVRLMYLALHYHQHRFAISEAKARFKMDGEVNATCLAELARQYGIGMLDYECPGAKYIIVRLVGDELGTNVRGSMVPALIMGLVTNRVVLFVNNAPQGATGQVQEPWPLASCPRQDYQCFFMPTSPCVLTQKDIQDAYTLAANEARDLLYKEQLPDSSLDQHTVWRYESTSTPVDHVAKLAAQALYQRAMELISLTTDPNASSPHTALLTRAAETIRTPDAPRVGYHYAAASNRVQHTLALYATRPNPSSAQKLNDMIANQVPNNLDPETSLGVHIRGTCIAILKLCLATLAILTPFSTSYFAASEKCNAESECLSFDQHMQVAADLWQGQQNATGAIVNPTVIFSTESTQMVHDQQAFVAENRQARYPFNFSFVRDERDLILSIGKHWIRQWVLRKSGKKC
jgi:hypothetical protein